MPFRHWELFKEEKDEDRKQEGQKIRGKTGRKQGRVHKEGTRPKQEKRKRENQNTKERNSCTMCSEYCMCSFVKH